MISLTPNIDLQRNALTIDTSGAITDRHFSLRQLLGKKSGQLRRQLYRINSK